jgi:hypothetical protein
LTRVVTPAAVLSTLKVSLPIPPFTTRLIRPGEPDGLSRVKVSAELLPLMVMLARLK